MRPIKLTMAGFGPFASEVELDFSAFGTEGLFLMTGKTGAGKSTIFHGLVFALYGSQSVAGRESRSLRSDFAKPGSPFFVRLEFEANGERYLVERTPSYYKVYERGPKKGRLKSTAEAATAVLTMPDGSVLSKPAEVNEAIAGLLGIEEKDFCQVVMIAQGDFRRLLAAESKDRQKVFRRLFGTGAIEAFQRDLKDRAFKLERAVASIRDQALRAVGRVAAAPEAAGPVVEAREGLKAWAQSEGTDLAGALAMTAVLVNADEAEKEALDKNLAEARRGAEMLSAQLERARSREQAAKNLAEARASLPRLEEKARSAAGALFAEKENDPRRERMAASIAVAKAQMERYDEAASAAGKAEKAEAKARRCQAAAEKADDACASARAARELAADKLDGLRGKGADEASLREAIAKAEAAVEGAKKDLGSVAELKKAYQRLQSARSAAEGELGERQREYERLRGAAGEAGRSYLELRRRRDDGVAGLLAHELRAGEPCPVCGSREHPAPAGLHEGMPTDAEVEEAQAAADRAQQAQTAASQALAAARASFEGAQAALEAAGREHGDLDALEERARALQGRQAEHARAAAAARAALQDWRDAEQEDKDAADALKRAQEAAVGRQKELADAHAEAKGARELAERLARSLPSASKDEAERALEGLERELEASRSALVAAQKAADAADEALRHCSTAAETLEAQLAAAPESEGDVAGLEARQGELKERERRLTEESSRAAARLSANRQVKGELAELKERSAKACEEYAAISAVARAANGQGSAAKVPFETYVQARWLDRVLEAANRRYGEMSDGRYRLERRAPKGMRSVTGLDLDVVDEYTGKSRSADTLSGGESFEASLALALGLSDVVQARAGGVRIETMFVDEGFGSLDQEALAKVIATLSRLGGSGKLVGVISHVDEMRAAIDRQVVVERSRHGSTIEVRA